MLQGQKDTSCSKKTQPLIRFIPRPSKHTHKNNSNYKLLQQIAHGHRIGTPVAVYRWVQTSHIFKYMKQRRMQ